MAVSQRLRGAEKSETESEAGLSPKKHLDICKTLGFIGFLSRELCEQSCDKEKCVEKTSSDNTLGVEWACTYYHCVDDE